MAHWRGLVLVASMLVTACGGPGSPLRSDAAPPDAGSPDASGGSTLSAQLREDFWVVEGYVFASASDGDALYVGGAFEYVGPPTGSLVALDAAGQPDSSWARADGRVRVIVPDAAGGWYVAGALTEVDGVPQRAVVHILANGQLDAMFASGFINGEVTCMSLSGNTLFVGGLFSRVGGEARDGLAALDARAGALRPWNPGATDDFGAPAVAALAVIGDRVFVGGSFLMAGGASRWGIAAIDATTGEATSWDPFTGGFANVKALAVHDTTVYVSGSFTEYFAAFDAETGARRTEWAPAADGPAAAMIVDGDAVLVGGDFTTIGGEPRRGLAAIDPLTGAALPWDPSPDGPVLALAMDATSIVVGGTFTTVGAEQRRNVARFTRDDGLPTTWSPAVGGAVEAVAIAGELVLAGGSFASAGGLPRRNVAAFDLRTGRAIDWNPSADAPVFVVLAAGDTVFTGGRFTEIGGRARSHLAALDATSGQAMEWAADTDAEVYALAVSTETLFVGGAFGTIGSVPRAHLAAVDVASGSVLSWAPEPNGAVGALAVDEDTAYIGGRFSTIAGASREWLAAVDVETVTVRAWDPRPTIVHPNPAVQPLIRALAVGNGVIYVGGFFDGIGGMAAWNLGALDLVTGAATPSWRPRALHPSLSPPVQALASGGPWVYVGGVFTSFEDGEQSHFGAIHGATGTVVDWAHAPNGSVTSITASGDQVVVGGWFDRIAGQKRPGVAVFEVRTL